MAVGPQYPILAERLLLRPLDPARDVDAVLAYHSRPEVMRFLGVPPRDRAGVVEFLTSPRTRSVFDVPGQAISLAAVRHDTGELIGDVSLTWLSGVHERGEFGCVLNPDHHGQGFALEACRALLRYAFDGLGLHRVIARLDARNSASEALMRRIGLRSEARFVDEEKIDGEWVTMLVYAIVADEFRETSGRNDDTAGDR